MGTDVENSNLTKAWPNYRTVWRWHFYAGLFCIPFVIWLGITGSIYLFRPQMEAWLESPYEHLNIQARPQSGEAEIMTALKAVPGSNLHYYELPRTARSAVRVIVGKGAEEFRVYIHPQTLSVLKIVNEYDPPYDCHIPSTWRTADGRPRIVHCGTGGVMGHCHDPHRPLLVVAQGTCRLGRSALSQVPTGWKNLLARLACGHGHLGVSFCALSIVYRPAVGKELGYVPGKDPGTHAYGVQPRLDGRAVRINCGTPSSQRTRRAAHILRARGSRRAHQHKYCNSVLRSYRYESSLARRL